MIAGAALASVAVPAAASPLDQASTARFVSEATHYVHGLIGTERAQATAASRYLIAIRSGCPDALPSFTASVTQAQSNTLSAILDEGSLGLSLAELAAVKRSAQTTGRLFARLQWSDRKIATAITGSTTLITRLTAIGLPHLCADVRTAAAGGFATVPAATARVIKAGERALNAGGKSSGLPELLVLMKPYVTAADAKPYARLRKLNTSYLKSDTTVAQDAFQSLLEILVSTPYP